VYEVLEVMSLGVVKKGVKALVPAGVTTPFP